jgi:alpha-acetolactate decarboxylase
MAEKPQLSTPEYYQEDAAAPVHEVETPCDHIVGFLTDETVFNLNVSKG